MILLPTAVATKHVLGGIYVGSSSAVGYVITGTGLGLIVTTGVAVGTLVLLIVQGNRKTRREVASDMVREKRRSKREGRKEKDAEWRSWLNFGLATGAIQLRPGAPTLPPAAPGPDDDDESEGDDDDD